MQLIFLGQLGVLRGNQKFQEILRGTQGLSGFIGVRRGSLGFFGGQIFGGTEGGCPMSNHVEKCSKRLTLSMCVCV